MANRVTPWPFLIHFRPQEAERRIRSAFRKAGTLPGAAKLLDISSRQLYRFCTALKLELGRVKKEARTQRQGPRKAERGEGQGTGGN